MGQDVSSPKRLSFHITSCNVWLNFLEFDLELIETLVLMSNIRVG